jgi:hypothetical protein
MAQAFVVNNRDALLRGALRAIDRTAKIRRMLEREQREWAKRIERNSKLLSKSETLAARGLPLNECHA